MGSIGARLLVERGLILPPESGAPGVFSMADEERTRALLETAGFEDIRTDEVAMRFVFRDIEDYMQWAIDMAGPLGMVMRGLSAEVRREITAELADGFARFAADGGYELPGLALCAVANAD